MDEEFGISDLMEEEFRSLSKSKKPVCSQSLPKVSIEIKNLIFFNHPTPKIYLLINPLYLQHNFSKITCNYKNLVLDQGNNFFLISLSIRTTCVGDKEQSDIIVRSYMLITFRSSTQGIIMDSHFPLIIDKLSKLFSVQNCFKKFIEY